jgi:tape measure domain-containing protein
MAKRISSLSVVLGATVKPFVSAFQSVRSTVTGFTSSLGSAGSTLLKFTGIGAAIGGAFAAIKGAASGITLAAELEQVGVAFETMLGSADAAKAMMAELTQFSASTPFEFPEIAASAKQLLAFGIGADKITAKLTMLGDIAAGTGKPLGDLAAIYGKIKSRGQLTGETLNQLAEAGVPIYRALAKQLGVAESQVAAMVTAGKVGFPQLDAALGTLTATGGQFAGLMEKQSRTLGGLWSTLSDNIGLTLAGLVTTIVDAFGLRDALAAFTGWVGTVGGAINAAVARYAPLIVGFGRTVWSAVVAAFTAVYNFVVPIVGAIGEFVARNWQTTVATWTAYTMSLWNAASAVFTAVWGIVQWAGSQIAAAWTWAMDLIGVKTSEAGATTGGVFQSIYNAGAWLMNGLTLVFNTIAYAVTHWQDTLTLAGVNVALFAVRTANQFAYIFTEVIPAYLDWFAQNWRDIFTTAFEFLAAIFRNGWANILNFFAALKSFLSGGGFNFQWTALTEGFTSSIRELPKIAEREIGPLEASLQQQADTLGAAYTGGLGKYLSDQQQAAKQAAAGVTQAAANAVKALDVPAPATPELPKLNTANLASATDEMNALGRATKDTADKWDALVAGSAEAMQAAAKARFAEMTAAGVAGPAGSAVSSPAKAAPVPAAAREAIAGAAKSGATNRDDLLSVVRSILAEIKGADRVELATAA